MDQIREIISKAQEKFKVVFTEAVHSQGLTQEMYVRFLSMQYHLTNGVQRHFFAAASHPDICRKKNLREFLYQFGIEEEPHFKLAESDLKHLGKTPLPINLDTTLWWTYFNSIILERPFVRLGATCILENISGTSGDIIKKSLKEAKYITPQNSKFVVVHQHDDLPHGDQILKILVDSKLSQSQMDDVEEGAKIGTTMYLRMFHWVVTGES